MNYNDVRDMMQTHHDNVAGKKGVLAKVDPHEKRIGNQTVLRNHNDGTYGLKLFDNEIIVWGKEDVTLLDHTWFTRTTFDRFNTFLPSGFKVLSGRAPWRLGTIGIIKTPAGTFPYNLPLSFRYNGELCGGGYTSQALAAFQGLVAYVQVSVRMLLQRAHTSWDFGYRSEEIARNIRAQLHGVGTFTLLLDGLVPPEIYAALIEVGDVALRKAKNATERARQAELTLDSGYVYEQALALKGPTGHRMLREDLYRFLLGQLGFTLNEWNRR